MKKIIVSYVFISLLLVVGFASNAAVNYVGNVKSKVFHELSCRYANCKKCIVSFKTRKAAIKLGYKPCKVCKP